MWTKRLRHCDGHEALRALLTDNRQKMVYKTHTKDQIPKHKSTNYSTWFCPHIESIWIHRFFTDDKKHSWHSHEINKWTTVNTSSHQHEVLCGSKLVYGGLVLVLLMDQNGHTGAGNAGHRMIFLVLRWLTWLRKHQHTIIQNMLVLSHAGLVNRERKNHT